MTDARARGGELDLIGLLERILTGVPPLPGGPCTSSPRLFDPACDDEPPTEVDDRHAIALDICHTCPVLAACRRWVADLPEPSQPAGVVAGIAPGRRGRPRKAIA